MFQSDRSFQLWRAVVGHSQLLLRSTKTEANPTRIEILFKPVRAMKIRTVLEGIRVREARPAEAQEIAREIAETDGSESTFFVIESGDFSATWWPDAWRPSRMRANIRSRVDS
jgi:hypothetical protein